MSIGFFIMGGIIFMVYLYFMIYNIYYSNKKQKEENYPEINIEEETLKSKKSDDL